MKRLNLSPLVSALLFSAVVQSASCFDQTDDTIDFHGPDVRPGYPDLFHLHYILPKDTISPDGKYGVIFPDRMLGEMQNDSLHDFVVSLDPSQILAELKSDSPEFEGKSNGGYEIKWAQDSSVALITFEARWGPGEFFVIELRDGRVSRTTDLDSEVHQLLQSEYQKSAKKGSNDSADGERIGFIFGTQTSDPPNCELEKPMSVRIEAFVTVDPKGQAARFDAIWDIRKAAFSQHHVTRMKWGSEERL
jgi:hypothetical protein